ncbi:GTPase HflX [Sphingomonas aquatilis]|uniref:GTPase HflX n=1 Tax=Sphingomonas aquatilis TaxID=93063 RepID=A0AAW3TXM1_9SPHN|nr:GTPase HflX [Sphingomonas aquatilis]MBB3876245.1 GTP-binding protein HflX [Sphingomonas aquatilis]MCI4652808.1 GTPase HflX [Sphingomonas aquatilis]GEM71814.1 GTPase HflX [Sphingomonas aquatilis NBRC 16722]
MSTGFNRDRDEFARGGRALIVLPDQGDAHRDAEARLEETAGLAAAIGLVVTDKVAVRVRQPKPATLIGSGQVEQLAVQVRQDEADLVVFDASLTPVQQRNLETALEAKVIDRTGLILEIFGERAATAEGRLQVELAHLDYQAGRLVRSWTHLERQRGGFGFLGGPGETQIEADRRLIRDRMARLRRELEQVSRTRGLHRERRQRAPWPVIALVGYTNAGKSTLFNRLTGAHVMAENLLFATLDPTLRQISLPGIDKAILSDTVGFVSDLPTQLVAAFKATLEEVVSADLLIHVRDIAHPDTEAQRADVEAVLAEIGVSETTPRFEAWNKLDLLDADQHEGVLVEAARRDDVVALSALDGEGVDQLVAQVAAKLTAGHRRYWITLPAGDGAGAAWLHAHGEVLGQEEEGEGLSTRYEVRLAERDYERFLQR